MTEVTERAASLANQICACATKPQHKADVEAILAYRHEVQSEMETRFWSIVDPNSVPSDMWEALNRMAASYRQAKEKDATIHQLGENAAKAAERVAALEGALRKIDRMNDHPQWFRKALNDILEAALTEPTDEG